MHLKRFRRESVREALRAVKEELGPHALILGTEMVAARGVRGWIGAREVQVTAALDREAMAADRPEASAGRHSVMDVNRRGVIARLMAAGLDRSLAEAVAASLSPAECRSASFSGLRAALARQLETVTSAADEVRPRIEVLVGPPGVGKTTTIAKIAAQARIRSGERLSIVSADGFRPGAIEQLRAYADIIGAPFGAARSADELARAVGRGHQPVLVDTAGASPHEAAVRNLLNGLAGRRGVRTHLVLAADTSVAATRRVFETYTQLHPDRLIVSKLDEADSLSPLAGLIRDQALPISYVTTGQRVPEDIETATPALLAAAILRDGRTEARP